MKRLIIVLFTLLIATGCIRKDNDHVIPPDNPSTILNYNDVIEAIKRTGLEVWTNVEEKYDWELFHKKPRMIKISDPSAKLVLPQYVGIYEFRNSKEIKAAENELEHRLETVKLDYIVVKTYQAGTNVLLVYWAGTNQNEGIFEKQLVKACNSFLHE